MLHSVVWGPRDCLEKQAGPRILLKSYEDRATLGSDSSAYDSRKAGRGAVHFPWPSPVPFVTLQVCSSDLPGPRRYRVTQ